MERTDWLDQGYEAAEARFLMLTAITHHRFDAPIWGQDEVRKLHLELTEIDMLTTQAADEYVGEARRAPGESVPRTSADRAFSGS
jgi:hypothetical protein